MATSFGKEMAHFFFSKGNEIVENGKTRAIFTCKCNALCAKTFKIVISAGYGNLKGHLIACKPNFQALYDNRAAGGDLLNFVDIDKKCYNIFKWCELVVSENLCFSYVEKKLVRENSCRDPISRSTLMKYLDSLGYEVQGVLANIVPDKFGLVFDGWDSGSSVNFFGVFVIWWDEKRKANRVYLLRLCPLIDETDLGAQSHLDSIISFLSDIDRTLDNVVCMMGDNCTVNLSLAHKAHKPFIGCHSHRLNLAVNLFIAPHQLHINKVRSFMEYSSLNDFINLYTQHLITLLIYVFQINRLMVSLSTKKNAATLRLIGCRLKPVKLFVVKWSGIYNMLHRYIAIRQYLNPDAWVDIASVVDHIPTAAAHLEILQIFEDLKKFQDLSMELQKENGSLATARGGCDWLRQQFPITNAKLGPNFCHSRNRAFESGVTKVQSNNEANLTAAEKIALEPLLKNNVEVVDDPADEEDVSLQGHLKRQRLEPLALLTNYMVLLFILASTNLVERLFSMTRKIYTEDRKRMTPDTLELIMFLKINMELWDEKLVYKIRRNPRPRFNAVELDPGDLDDGDFEEYVPMFIQGNNDPDFWEDDNIAIMLGDVDVE